MANISAEQFAEIRTPEFKEQAERADQFAKSLIKHQYNENGEHLARVEESPGFQEVYDYTGGQARQHRLSRKREQVSNTFSSRSHLFQKVYYANNLTTEDETSLRVHFNNVNQMHERDSKIMKLAFLVGGFASAYNIARTQRPLNVFVFIAGVACAYKGFAQPFHLQLMQSQLNDFAVPMAKKYGCLVEDL